MNRRVYFDYSSTTNVHPDVLKAYMDLLKTTYVNSESLYDEGTLVSRNLEKARNAISELLKVHPDEIIFTSGASEANSEAIKSVSFSMPEKKHIITSEIEHSSVLNACKQMEDVFGYRVTYLPVNEQGIVSVKDLKNALDNDTSVVSLMSVNNETGAINPIEEIKEIVKKTSSAYMHVDMTQAIGKVPCSFENIDLASMSAHKIEGLKGSGILVKKKHVPFVPLINGGEQEYGLRGGTNNACTNMVFAKTLRIALENEKKYHDYVQKLQTLLLNQLKEIDGVEINNPENNLCSIVNFSYENIPSEVMQNALNRMGFMISARSTCESKSNNPSYVLKAMGYSDRRASSCIRISLSYHNTEEDILDFIKALKEIISHYG
ncbi:MAG: cysteine desulfurase [Erysipelotrichaceae bacterium]|nr:cysteine desulfurase [Erysipelotrichaceae bacterium]